MQQNSESCFLRRDVRSLKSIGNHFQVPVPRNRTQYFISDSFGIEDCLSRKGLEVCVGNVKP